MVVADQEAGLLIGVGTRQLLYSQQIPAINSEATSYYPGNITALDPSTWTLDDNYFKERMMYQAGFGIIIALLTLFVCIL